MTDVGIATGAGRGMGYACAERLATSVDVLLLVDRDEAGLKSAADSLAGRGAELVPVVLDVTDADGVAALASQVASLGAFRALAHAAGISPTMADWRAIFEVDLVGSARLLDALYPLVTDGSAAVCFASMAATLGRSAPDPAVDAALDDPLGDGFLDAIAAAVPGIADTGVAYSWAKWGVQRLARREALRWGPRGGRVCSVSPGIIDTPQGRQEAEAHPMMALLVEHSPLRREGRSDELAAVVAFLLSDEASFLTGTDVLVDGGAVAAVMSGALGDGLG